MTCSGCSPRVVSRSPSVVQSPSASSSRGSPSSSKRPVVELFELDLQFGGAARTRTQTQFDPPTRRPHPQRARAQAPAATSAPQASAGTRPRGYFYRAIWHLWDVTLVKPLQAIAALLGVAVGIGWVAGEATWDVFRQLGHRLLRTFWGAVLSVHRRRSAPPRAAKAAPESAAVAVTPLSSPSLGGRTPSPVPSLYSPASSPEAEPVQRPSTMRRERPVARLRSPSPLRLPEPFASAPSLADGRVRQMPEAIVMALPEAICSTCEQPVTAGGACEHMALDVELAVRTRARPESPSIHSTP